MFIVLIEFIEQTLLNQYLNEHRQYLDECYQKGYFLASGQNESKTGGVIISLLDNQEKLQIVLDKDPIFLNQIAKYEILQFTPSKYHPLLKKLLNQSSRIYSTAPKAKL